MKHVAVVCAQGLGDALLSMIVSHNLLLSRLKVTTFSSILCGLKHWFPNHSILPYPAQDAFKAFDTVIAIGCSQQIEEHDNLIVFNESHFDKKLSMAENLKNICQTRLDLPYAEKGNGLVIPTGLAWRSHANRVVIHPYSSHPKKNWPANKFIELGKQLEKRGFDPYFCVSSEERKDWIKQVAEKQVPVFQSIHEIACFIFESDSMVGNDSELGHLASLLNIPTLSLFARKSYSQLWRPGWSEGLVVAPPGILPGTRLRQKYWKQLLSVRKVLRTFSKMGAER